LTKSAATGIVDKYSQSISLHLCHLPVMNSDHVRASMLLDGWKSSLRAGDSLHLAISSARGATVYTLDRGMANAGALLGIAVKLL
jgi:predicted nucleic acid-binding protein